LDRDHPGADRLHCRRRVDSAMALDLVDVQQRDLKP
jgi:hypothetical protein